MKILSTLILLIFSVNSYAEIISCIAKAQCSTLIGAGKFEDKSECHTKNIKRGDLFFDLEKLELIGAKGTKVSDLQKINDDIYMTGNILIHNFSQDKKLLVSSIVETNAENNENTAFMVTYKCSKVLPKYQQ